MKQDWSLLYSIVDLFEKIKEGVEFSQAVTNPIPGGKSGEHHLLNHPQDWGNGKNLSKLGEIPVVLNT